MIITLHIIKATPVIEKRKKTGAMALWYEMSMEELTGANKDRRMGKWKLNSEQWALVQLKVEEEGKADLLGAETKNVIPDLKKLLDLITLDFVDDVKGGEDWAPELSFDTGDSTRQGAAKPGVRTVQQQDKKLSGAFAGADSLGALNDRKGCKLEKGKVQTALRRASLTFEEFVPDFDEKPIPRRKTCPSLRTLGRKVSAVDLRNATADVDGIHEGDKALVLRGDGTWTYGELKRRSVAPEEMEFVVGVDGETKVYPGEWYCDIKRIVETEEETEEEEDIVVSELPDEVPELTEEEVAKIAAREAAAERVRARPPLDMATYFESLIRSDKVGPLRAKLWSMNRQLAKQQQQYQELFFDELPEAEEGSAEKAELRRRADKMADAVSKMEVKERALRAELDTAHEESLRCHGQEGVTLDLSDSGIRENKGMIDGWCKVLKQWVQPKHLVMVLDLSKNSLGAKGLLMVSEAVKLYKPLLSLDLSANNLLRGSLKPGGVPWKHDHYVQDLSGLKALGKVLETKDSLLQLSIGGNHLATAQGGKIIGAMMSGNKSLTTLDLSNNRARKEVKTGGWVGENPLLPSKQWCPDGLKFMEAICASLQSEPNIHITSLDVSGNGAGKPGGGLLLQLLTAPTNVLFSANGVPVGLLDEQLGPLLSGTGLSLDLSCQGYGVSEAVLLEHYIGGNLALSELDLSQNNFGGFYLDKGGVSQEYIMTPGGPACIAIALLKNSSIKTVNLSSIELGGKADREGVVAVAAMLKCAQGNSMTRLDLSYNKLSAKDSTLVADGLRTNEVLQWLNLTGNEIRAKGAKRIFTALRAEGNTTLETLLLAENKVLRKDVARALAETLTENDTLQEIDLSNNNWEREFAGSGTWGGEPSGFVKILSAVINDLGVKYTSGLRKLNLSGNHISEKKRKALRVLCGAKHIELTQ
jgi:Leucine-rich repeat (LRR) protein